MTVQMVAALRYGSMLSMALLPLPLLLLLRLVTVVGQKVVKQNCTALYQNSSNITIQIGYNTSISKCTTARHS